MSVVVVGSLNMDAITRVDRLPGVGETVLAGGLAWTPGGKGANQAVAAARLGASVALVGRIGDDDGGHALVACLDGEGVDTTAVRVTTGTPTGVALITVDGSGANTIVVAPSANAALTPADVDAAASLIERAAVVLAQLEIPLETATRALELARASGATTVLNPSPAQVLDDELLGLVDVLVANEHEAGVVGAASACGAVVTTMGERGAVIAEGASYPSHRVDAVDTTGAGDAFCGALAAQLAAGRALGDAVRTAVAAGALAVTRPGALPSLPTAAEVAALLEEERA
jgi:ribokinase